MKKSNLISNIIILVFFVACKQEKVEQLGSIVAKKQTSKEMKKKDISEKDITIFCNKHFGFPNNLSTIFVLTDQDCMSCNRAFSEFIQHYLMRKDVGFIIESAGAMVDISPFIQQQKRPNLVFDQEHLLVKNRFSSKSGAYLLKNNLLDTLVYIHAATLEQDFKYIENTLN